MLHDRTVTTSSGALRITESDGDGSPILMLHGSGSCRAVFGRQLDGAIAKRHRLIAVDLPGHGESDNAADPDSYSLRGMSRTIGELIARLRLERFMILGWSLGGHIAIELIEHAGLSGIVACGTPPVSRGPLAMLRAFRPSWDMPLASKEDFSARDVARFFSLCYGRGATPELLSAVQRADGRVRSATVRSMMRGECSDQREAVLGSAIPVALINGREDPFLRLAYLDTLAGPTLWHGVPLVIEEAGHACFWDQPEMFNELLAGFAADAETLPATLPFRASA
jgi:pimeloyl-ACP methyl ester carboxylesterase